MQLYFFKQYNRGHIIIAYTCIHKSWIDFIYFIYSFKLLTSKTLTNQQPFFAIKSCFFYHILCLQFNHPILSLSLSCLKDGTWSKINSLYSLFLFDSSGWMPSKFHRNWTWISSKNIKVFWGVLFQHQRYIGSLNLNYILYEVREVFFIEYYTLLQLS